MFAQPYKFCLVHEDFHLHQPGIGVTGHSVGDHPGESDERLGTLPQALELTLATSVLAGTAPGGRALALGVLGVDDVHAGEQDLGDVPPDLVLKDPEIGHHAVHLGLAEGHDLEKEKYLTKGHGLIENSRPYPNFENGAEGVL